MSVTFVRQPLMDYARAVLARPAELWSLKTSPIEGGYIAASIYRHDLVFRLSDGRCETLSVVQKYTVDAEVRLMQALANVCGAEAVPLLIDAARNPDAPHQNGASWFITPFYEGSSLTWEDEMPPPIIETLACVHMQFIVQAARWDWLHRVDAAFFRRTFDNALAAGENVLAGGCAYRDATTYADLQRLSDNPVVYGALARLPVTLTHGDVHPENIIHRSDGTFVLIDWGTARIAPAMLDVANMVKIDSRPWHQYLSACDALAGEVQDKELARLGYHWATVMTNIRYLPFAASRRPERVPEMVARAAGAADAIAAFSIP